MKLLKIGKFRMFIIGLCLVGVVGFFLPAIHVGFSVFFIEGSTSFSLATIFENREDDDPFNLDHFDPDNFELVTNVAGRAVFSIMAYFAAGAALLTVAILAILNRFNLAKIICLVAAFLLYVAAGRMALTLPDLINIEIKAIAQNMLGILAAFIDLSQTVTLRLGAGFWLTLTALTGMLLAEIASAAKRIK